MKTPLFFIALLCVGTVELGLVQSSIAQPAPPTYSQILVQSQQDLKDKDYEAVEEEAQRMLTQANTLNEKGDALIILGESFYGRKMYEQAREQWSKVLTLEAKEDDEDDFQTIAHIALGKSHTAEGHFDKAIPEYKAVIKSFEEEAKTDEVDTKTQEGTKSLGSIFSLALANAYYHTNQLDLAGQQLGDVVKPSQNSPLGALTDLTRMLGLTRSAQMDMEQRRFKKSLDEFNQALAIEDKFDKEVPTTTEDDTHILKEYIQKQIEGLNKLIPLQLGEGEINNHMAFRVKRDNEFNAKVDKVIQMLIDDIVFASLLQTLGTDD